MRDLKLSEIKQICTEHQKQNRDCDTCEILMFCQYDMNKLYPIAWEIEEEVKE